MRNGARGITRRISFAVVMAGLAALVACGGGGNGGGSTPTTLTITTSSLSNGVRGQAYVTTLTSTGGSGVLTWTVSSGALPAGVSLGSAGTISGTPTTAGTANFSVQVTDSSSPTKSASKALSIIIAEPLAITTTTLPDGKSGVSYNQTLAASGGAAPHTWGLASGSGPLPPGLNLDAASGTISGTPSQEGSFNFTVEVQDSSSPAQVASQAFTLTIVTAAALSISTSTLPSTTVPPGGTLTAGYSAGLQAIGGVGSLEWSLAAGSNPLPSGLTLSLDGVISGNAISPGLSTFTVEVRDTLNPPQVGSRQLSIDVLGTAPGRNDTIATATPLSNGTYAASLSPYADFTDPAPTANPDVDVYEISAVAGNIVTVELFAKRLSPASPLDSTIEIVSSAGVRLTTCRNEGNFDGLGLDFNFDGSRNADPTPDAFDDPCLNDDIDAGIIQDSRIQLQVPSGDTTFYVRVTGFRGRARPTFVYEIQISGVN